MMDRKKTGWVFASLLLLLSSGTLQALAAPPVTFTGHKGKVWSVSFSSRGDRLVSTSSDGTARIWDVRAGSVIGVLTMQGANGVVDSAFSPIDGTLATCNGREGDVHLWHAASGKLIRRLEVPEDANGISTLKFAPTSSKLP
jgi:WD40 repeat protein